MLRIKEILSEKGVTGKLLAEKVGVTQVSISNILNGNHFPKPELLKSIAKELDVDIRGLFISTKSSPSREQIYVKRLGDYVPIGEVDFEGNY